MNEEKLNELKAKLEEGIKYQLEEFEDRKYIKYAYYDIFESLSIKEQIDFLLYCIDNDSIESGWNFYFLEEEILKLDLNQQTQSVIELYNFNKSKDKDEIISLISKVLRNLFVKQKMSLEKAVDLFIVSFKKKNEQLDIDNITTIFDFFKDKKSEFTLEVYEKIKYLLDDGVAVKSFGHFFKEILEFPINFNELFKVTKKIFLACKNEINLHLYVLSLINKRDTDINMIFDFVLNQYNYIYNHIEFGQIFKYFTIEQQNRIIDNLIWYLYELSNKNSRICDNAFNNSQLLKQFIREFNIKINKESSLIIKLIEMENRFKKIEDAMYSARVVF
jgi:hypothetical protein